MRTSRLRLLAASVLLLTACSEQPYRHYASASGAMAAGERERGWLPRWLPASARDVHLQNDADTNAWWLRSRLSPAAADSLRALLAPVAAEAVVVQRPRSAGGWWFPGLIEHGPANDGALAAELFRGTGSPVPRATFVVFERTSDVVFVWTVDPR